MQYPGFPLYLKRSGGVSLILRSNNIAKYIFIYEKACKKYKNIYLMAIKLNNNDILLQYCIYINKLLFFFYFTNRTPLPNIR